MIRALFILVLLAGCVHGQRLRDFPPAHTPRGLDVVVTPTGEGSEITGELLAVRDDGLVIGTPSRIVLVAYARIRDGSFPAASRLRIGAGRTPGSDKLKELSLLSRYPQGLDGALLERLLETYVQSELEEIR